MLNKETQIEQHLAEIYSKLFAALGRFSGSFIAGGSIASLALGETPNDYDVWFENEDRWRDATDRVLAVAAIHNTPVSVLAQTNHAVTFRVAGISPVFQFVKSRCGDPYDVVEQFDFLHTQAFFYLDDSGEGSLEFANRNSIEFIEERVLVFEGDLDYPTHTLSRIAKFALRGWKIPDRTLAALIRAIREADVDLINKDLQAVGTKYHGMRYDEQQDTDKVFDGEGDAA